jgi:HD-GYP domain-containing protein (c-di-GMP phosphodiesterase class II)
MLQLKGGYEQYELADIAFLVTLHDVGAYKTENVDNILKFETKDFRAHSLYGYLFMKGLSSIGEMSKVILYHHTDFSQLSKIDFKYIDLTAYVCLAGMVDIFSESLGERFSMDIFQKQLGSRISPEAYKLFVNAERKYDMSGRIKSNEYKKELDDLMDYFILTNEDKERWMLFLMFTLSLKSELAIIDAIICLALCEKLGQEMGLSAEQQELLRYACYVHDIGMLALPKSWIENQGKITIKEMERMKQHPLLMERLLQERLKKEIVNIAATHHERGDGSGYPRKLTDKQFGQSQIILQFADAMSGLLNPRPDKPVPDKDKIVEYIRKQTEVGRFNLAIARIFLEKYDEMIEYVKNRSRELLVDYRRLNTQYANAMEKKE